MLTLLSDGLRAHEEVEILSTSKDERQQLLVKSLGRVWLLGLF